MNKIIASLRYARLFLLEQHRIRGVAFVEYNTILNKIVSRFTGKESFSLNGQDSFFLNTIIKFENECTLENSSSIPNTRAILLRRRKIYVSIEKDVHVDKDSESSPEGEINSE